MGLILQTSMMPEPVYWPRARGKARSAAPNTPLSRRKWRRKEGPRSMVSTAILDMENMPVTVARAARRKEWGWGQVPCCTLAASSSGVVARPARRLPALLPALLPAGLCCLLLARRPPWLLLLGGGGGEDGGVVLVT